MPKSKDPNRELKRQKIVDAAVQVLNRMEFLQCPVDEIARTAGIAKGTIYLYFKSKDELYFAVFFHLIDRIRAMVADVQKGRATAARQLQLLLKRMSAFLGEHRQIFLALRQAMGPVKEPLHRELHRKYDELVDELSTVVEKGIAAGEFRDRPARVVSAVFLSAGSIIAHQKIEPTPRTEAVSPELLFDIIMNGIGASA